MEGQQHQMKKAAEKMGDELNSLSISEELKKAASEYTKESSSAKEAMGLSSSLLEGIYGQAYRLYNTGKYKEASQLFRLLLMLDAKEPKYMLGLGACFHMLKEFQNAVSTYTICGVTDTTSPLPHYHASDCYIQMKDKISALIALEMAVTRAGERPEYKTLKDRALLTIDNLKKELAPKDL